MATIKEYNHIEKIVIELGVDVSQVPNISLQILTLCKKEKVNPLDASCQDGVLCLD